MPNVYNALICLADAYLKGSQISFDSGLIDSSDGNAIFVTCKDYQTKTGVASKLHMSVESSGNPDESYLSRSSSMTDTSMTSISPIMMTETSSTSSPLKDVKFSSNTAADSSTILNMGPNLSVNQGSPNSSNSWFVKGPLGMGLEINPNGHNFAFCGGTGVLVFLDLVA